MTPAFPVVATPLAMQQSVLSHLKNSIQLSTRIILHRTFELFQIAEYGSSTFSASRVGLYGMKRV